MLFNVQSQNLLLGCQNLDGAKIGSFVACPKRCAPVCMPTRRRALEGKAALHQTSVPSHREAADGLLVDRGETCCDKDDHALIVVRGMSNGRRPDQYSVIHVSRGARRHAAPLSH